MSASERLKQRKKKKSSMEETESQEVSKRERERERERGGRVRRRGTYIKQSRVQMRKRSRGKV